MEIPLFFAEKKQKKRKKLKACYGINFSPHGTYAVLYAPIIFPVVVVCLLSGFGPFRFGSCVVVVCDEV